MADVRFKALLFDVGQVIVGVTPLRPVRTLARRASCSQERVLAVFERNPWARGFQEGRVSPHEWHQHVCRVLGLRLGFSEFRLIWNSALTRRPILGKQLFARLAARYRLVLISNTDPLHMTHIRTNFEFPRYFHHHLFSYEIGLSKPSRGIYRAAIRLASTQPEEIFYVDDCAEFVQAALHLGIHAYRFRGRRALVTELRARGIL